MKIRIEMAIGYFLAIAITIASGCSSQPRAPKPPPPSKVVEVSFANVAAVSSEKESHSIAGDIKLSRDSTLRITGSYRPAELKQDVPIHVDVTRPINGKPLSYSSSGTADIKIDGGLYSFVVDVPAPQADPGNYDLTVKAGKRFIAHGKIVLIEDDSKK
jgi:hypothetical protein